MRIANLLAIVTMAGTLTVNAEETDVQPSTSSPSVGLVNVQVQSLQKLVDHLLKENVILRKRNTRMAIELGRTTYTMRSRGRTAWTPI